MSKTGINIIRCEHSFYLIKSKSTLLEWNCNAFYGQNQIPMLTTLETDVTGQWRVPLAITEPFFIQRAEPDWRLRTSSIDTHDLRLVFPHLAPEVLLWAIET